MPETVNHGIGRRDPEDIAAVHSSAGPADGDPAILGDEIIEGQHLSENPADQCAAKAFHPATSSLNCGASP